MMTSFLKKFNYVRELPFAFWVVIAATLMSQAGNMAFVFLVPYLIKLGFSLSAASFAFAIFSGSMLIGGLFAGSVVDKLGALRILTSALIANGLLLLIFPLMHLYFFILIFCSLWGLIFGLVRPASQTFVSYVSKPGLHKITFSVHRLAINLGMSAGPVVGGYLVYHSFYFIFIVNGIANVLAASILLIGLIRSAWFNYRPARLHKVIWTVKWLKQDPVLRLFVLGLIPVSMVFFQQDAAFPVFLSDDLGIPLSFYGWLFTINTLMIVLFELPLNIATINWPYRVNFILGTLFITLGFASFLFASLAWHIILLTMVATVGEMILFPAASSYIADIAPETHRGSYMSMYSTCSNLGMFLGPWSGAIIMQHFGAPALWVSCGFWGMISVVIFSQLKK